MWAAPALYSSATFSRTHTKTRACKRTHKHQSETHSSFALQEDKTICSHTSYRTLNPKGSRRAKCTTTKTLRLVIESACDGPPVDYCGERRRCTGNYEYTMLPGFLSGSHIDTLAPFPFPFLFPTLSFVSRMYIYKSFPLSPFVLHAHTRVLQPSKP